MTTENTPAPETTETPAPAAAAAPQVMPDRAPPEGCRFVLDSKTGVYSVERIPDQQKPDEKAPAIPDEKQDENQEAAPGVTLPDILPDYIRDNPETQALVADGVAAMQRGGEYTDEQAQRVVDLIAQFELEIGTEQPPLFEEDRIRSILRARWGEGHDGRLALVNKYVQARPALKAYLERTGAGNQLSVLEALGMIATGVTALTPAEASKRMDAMRQDPKSPLRDPYHKHHKVVVAQAKVWADIIERGEKKSGRQADVKELVADRTAKEPAGDSPEAKLKAEAAEIRRQPDYFRPGKNPELHRSLKARMAQIMRELYPS